MAILTNCPNCAYSLGPRDMECPRCGTPIDHHATGTVAVNRPVQAFFEISVAGRGAPRNFALQDQLQVYTIGRAASSVGGQPHNNVISVDTQALAVAPQHARLSLDSRDPTLPMWRFEDLGSPNGTYRNNQRVARPAILDDGDEIWLGPVGGLTSVRLLYHSAC